MTQLLMTGGLSKRFISVVLLLKRNFNNGGEKSSFLVFKADCIMFYYLITAGFHKADVIKLIILIILHV